MRVLHIPYTYFPDPVGGTEVYVAQLVRELGHQNVVSLVAAPGEADAHYVHDGVEVTRYAVSETTDRAEFHDAAGNPGAIAAIKSVLARERPDLVHFHAYTRGVPLEAAIAARAQSIPVIITYHSPTVTCARGTLIRNDSHVCDGALLVSRCARCVLRQHGLPGVLANMVGSIPPAVGRTVRAVAPHAGRVAIALRMTELMARRHDRVREHLCNAEAVVAPSGWVAELLSGEGLLEERIVVSPQGIDAPPAPVRTIRREGETVHFALPARYSPEKGIEIVLEAMRVIKSRHVRLDVFGPAQNAEARAYRSKLTALTFGDSRIRFLDAVAPEHVVATLAAVDAVLVPSMAKETGPLVVLEAFAAGVPVIGSALGGIAERVQDGVDGLLVPPGDVGEWTGALARFAADPDLRARLTAGVHAPRRMADVAAEMAMLYARVVGSRHTRASFRPLLDASR